MAAEREMREPTFVILSSLINGSRHGYAMIADALELSGGTVRLQAGTLYAALDRLRAEGLVGITEQEVVQGRARRYYALTEAGLHAVRTEAERRHAATGRALERLKKPGPVLVV